MTDDAHPMTHPSNPTSPTTSRWPAILLRLQAEEWQRAEDLAAALGVSQRTIYRDMQALDAAGLPIDAVPGKGYRLHDDYLLAPVTLTIDEAVTLVVGSAQAARHLSGRYRAAAASAQTKLADRLPDDARERTATLQSSLRLASERAFGGTDDRQMATLRRALIEGRRIRFHDRTESASRTMDPYGLVRHAATWHLVGYEHTRERVRHVRLDGLDDLALLDQTFERPDGYRTSLDGGALPDQTVRVLFSADVAASVTAAPSLHVVDTEQRPDGRLCMTLRVYHEREVLPWLLSWGAHAYVLEPEAMRRRVAQEARAIAARYHEAPTLMD